jgi:hypothetical protein
MQTLRSLACALAAVGFIGLSTGCIISDDSDPDATLTVFNDSGFTIVELNLVPNFSGTWGRDLLGGTDLLDGEEITLAVDCGFYDARLIDEDDFVCEVLDIDLCLNDSEWVITEFTLEDCDNGVLRKAPRSTKATQAQPADAASSATL